MITISYDLPIDVESVLVYFQNFGIIKMLGHFQLKFGTPPPFPPSLEKSPKFVRFFLHDGTPRQWSIWKVWWLRTRSGLRLPRLSLQVPDGAWDDHPPAHHPDHGGCPDSPPFSVDPPSCHPLSTGLTRFATVSDFVACVPSIQF